MSLYEYTEIVTAVSIGAPRSWFCHQTQKQAFVEELPVCHVVYLISTSEHLPV